MFAGGRASTTEPTVAVVFPTRSLVAVGRLFEFVGRMTAAREKALAARVATVPAVLVASVVAFARMSFALLIVLAAAPVVAANGSVRLPVTLAAMLPATEPCAHVKMQADFAFRLWQSWLSSSLLIQDIE